MKEYLKLIKNELAEKGEVRFYHDVDTILDEIEKIYKRKLIYKVTRFDISVKIEKRFKFFQKTLDKHPKV